MHTLKEIKDAISRLSAREDRRELTGGFDSQIRDSERQIREGKRPRTR